MSAGNRTCSGASVSDQSPAAALRFRRLGVCSGVSAELLELSGLELYPLP
jgi:hypothetical protein